MGPRDWYFQGRGALGTVRSNGYGIGHRCHGTRAVLGIRGPKCCGFHEAGALWTRGSRGQKYQGPGDPGNRVLGTGGFSYRGPSDRCTRGQGS